MKKFMQFISVCLVALASGCVVYYPQRVVVDSQSYVLVPADNSTTQQVVVVNNQKYMLVPTVNLPREQYVVLPWYYNLPDARYPVGYWGGGTYYSSSYYYGYHNYYYNHGSRHYYRGRR